MYFTPQAKVSFARDFTPPPPSSRNNPTLFFLVYEIDRVQLKSSLAVQRGRTSTLAIRLISIMSENRGVLL